MSNGTKIILVLIIVVIVGGIFFVKKEKLLPNPNPSSTATASPIYSQRPVSDMIHVISPKSNDLIDPTKPLLIEGQARGGWFFEASFPAKLIDANGNVLSQIPVQATGEWMTDSFVPFSGKMQFATPTTLIGTLILNKDNPSDMRQFDQSFKIPLRFNIQTSTVKVYFGNSEKNPNALDCNLVYAVNRTIPKTAEIARAALEELLKGPTSDEQSAKGLYFTSIPFGVKVKSLNIAGDVATADFDQTLQQNVGGSCRGSAIRSQITQTLMQFPTVKSVIISIDGRTEDILQP